MKNAGKIIGQIVPTLDEIFRSRTIKKCVNIMSDNSHPSSRIFQVLPSCSRLRSVPCKTKRCADSFYPAAIRLLNGERGLVCEIVKKTEARQFNFNPPHWLCPEFCNARFVYNNNTVSLGHWESRPRGVTSDRRTYVLSFTHYFRDTRHCISIWKLYFYSLWYYDALQIVIIQYNLYI